MPTKEDILKSLNHIIDPDFNKDIVALGFVKNIVISGGNVSFDIELTTPACPVKSEFQEKAVAAVNALPGVKDVRVQMTSAPRKENPALSQTNSTLKSVKSIIAVSSCKGGVGKSTVAACLAMELAQRGFSVGLVDADIYGPSIPTLLNLNQITVYANEQNQLIPIETQNLKVMSFGFLLGDSPAVLRGPLVSRYIQQILHQTAWGELDYLFIDMPPGTGDVQLTITQSAALSGAVIVTTRQTLSLVDVSRGILMFESVKVPMLGIIENMAYFICDQCHKKHFIFGGNEGNTLKERFGLATLVQLPILTELTQKLDKPFHHELIKTAVDRMVMALGKSSIEQKQIPQIEFDEKEVRLSWSSGKKIAIKNIDLRLSCRCALCIDEITGQEKIKRENIPTDIKALEVTPLGNYAVGIKWSDGHASGIYPYESIEESIAQSTK